MSGLKNRRFRLIVGLMMLALALAVLTAAGNALASAPQQAGTTTGAGKPAAAPRELGHTKARIESKAARPDVVLYDQYNNATTNATSAQNFEAANDAFDDMAADDFLVPGGPSWNIDTVEIAGAYFTGSTGPLASVNIVFHNDASGLPGAVVATRANQAYANGPNAGDLVVTLSSVVTLAPGHYSDGSPGKHGLHTRGQWGWVDRSVTSNSVAAWQNPGGGFAAGCLTWGQRGASCAIDAANPDQVFRLDGTFGATPTGTPPTATSTPTSTNTPSCGTGWTAGPVMPTAHVRAVGVWEPASLVGGAGRFYVMGGRSADTAGSDLQNPRYYNPATNTWTVSAAAFPDNQVNNMACADLIGAGVHKIYCVGGSAAGATVATSRVAVYNPVADTFGPNDDAWPPVNTVPGGMAVVSNKLYILGGFVVTGAGPMSRQIWQFDPNAGAGSRWVLKAGLVPDPVAGSNGLGYIPSAAIGTIIYNAGGVIWDTTGLTIVDNGTAFTYDTVADSVALIAAFPAPGTGETRALNVGGKVWVIGGGRVAPNPSANVMQYDPANPGAGWVGMSTFTGARRNFPVDRDPVTGKIYLSGGYMPTTATNSMQIYNPASVICTPTAGPTNTFTSTPTITQTPTITSTPTITPTPICPGSWTSAAPYPLPALDEAIAALGPNLYSFSGVVSGAIAANSYKYDLVANSWSAIAPLPGAREKPSAVTDGTFVYIFGGADTTGNNTNTLYRYDPVGNSYTVLASNPFTTTWAQAGAYLSSQNSIYWIAGCGVNCGTFSNTVYRYSIGGNSWSQVANYPDAVGFLAAFSDGTYVYGAGGINANELAKTYRYDPVANTWDDPSIADLPATRWGSASDVLKGKWILTGGYSGGNITPTGVRWNSVSNAWETVDLMLQPRARLAGGTIGTAFYAVAGREPGGAFGGTTDNQKYVNICQTPAGVINGHLTWQGISTATPNPVNQSPTGTLVLCSAGSPITYTFHTDASRNFTITTGLPDGSYNWRVKGDRHLATSGTLTISGGSVSVEFGLQKAGDIIQTPVSQQNIVNAGDFNAQKLVFGQACTCPSDLDYSGTVNASDFNTLKLNFGQAGAPVNCP